MIKLGPLGAHQFSNPSLNWAHLELANSQNLANLYPENMNTISIPLQHFTIILYFTLIIRCSPYSFRVFDINATVGLLNLLELEQRSASVCIFSHISSSSSSNRAVVRLLVMSLAITGLWLTWCETRCYLAYLPHTGFKRARSLKKCLWGFVKCSLRGF